MQALYLLALEPIAECTADGNSYGFRLKRSTADAMQKCFRVLAWKRAAQWILEGDIRGCFDNISHDWLIAHVPMDKTILRKWLKAGFIEGRHGGRLRRAPRKAESSRRCWLTWRWMGWRRSCGRSSNRPSKFQLSDMVNLVRYADDFIITGRSKEMLENEVKPLVTNFLRVRGLELSPEKTSITHIEQGFDFLGFTVRKYSGKLLIKPSKKGVHIFLERVRDLIRTHKQATQTELLAKLNPQLRGWAQYYRNVAAKRTFKSVDKDVWKALWSWAKRRHPQKGTGWVLKRYFKARPGCKWRFAVKRD